MLDMSATQDKTGTMLQIQTPVLFTSRTNFKFGPTQITKVRLLIQKSNLISRSTAVPNTVAGELVNIVSGFENILKLTK